MNFDADNDYDVIIPNVCIFHLPIILLTENLRCLTGRPFESFNRRSNALYRLGVLSATETSQKPIPCDAANDAPSDSLTCGKID